jgi:hypothetical protein
MRDQDAELRRYDVEAFARLHTDQDLGLAVVLRRDVRLDVNRPEFAGDPNS